MSQSVDLVIDWCSKEAAEYAVKHWHYSMSLPAAPAKFGVWEDGRFVGAILFARGAAMNIASPYGLDQTECIELVRVALDNHVSPVSKMVSAAIGKLKKYMPGLRLLVSYSDPNHNHLGIIYQAMNWIYVGVSQGRKQKINGKLYHPRTIYSRYGRQDINFLKKYIDPNAEWVDELPKYKYLYPLDRAMRRQIEPLAKPYPKHADVGEMESRTATSS